MLLFVFLFFFFKQKTAYEMCGRDWSSDVCSSDLGSSWLVDAVRDAFTNSTSSDLFCHRKSDSSTWLHVLFSYSRCCYYANLFAIHPSLSRSSYLNLPHSIFLHSRHFSSTAPITVPSLSGWNGRAILILEERHVSLSVRV